MKMVNPPIRVTLYQSSNATVDIVGIPGGRLVRIRLWTGGRWPELSGTWMAARVAWIPWFSPPTQLRRALRAAGGGTVRLLDWQQARATLSGFLEQIAAAQRPDRQGGPT